MKKVIFVLLASIFLNSCLNVNSKFKKHETSKEIKLESKIISADFKKIFNFAKDRGANDTSCVNCTEAKNIPIFTSKTGHRHFVQLLIPENTSDNEFSLSVLSKHNDGEEFTWEIYLDRIVYPKSFTKEGSDQAFKEILDFVNSKKN